MAPTIEQIMSKIQKGAFKPHIYLTNLCLAFFQAAGHFVAKAMFPIVPVALSSAKYYEFDKGDLARDNMARKPELGHVAPAIFGKRDKFYHCEVDQVITGIDQISALDYQRTNAPGAADPRRSKVRFIAEQMNIHLDRVWAEKFFNPQSWASVWEGVGAAPGSKQFYQFDNDNSDPVRLFAALFNTILLSGLREPNKICMGVNVYAALRTNPSILERIKYQGSEANPANVNANVLAQLFGVREVVVGRSVINKAPIGAKDDLRFICDPNSLLLAYVTDAPAIDEPSAGYNFAWDMLGNGQYTPIQQYEGPPPDHTEFAEGLLCSDPRIACPDLGVFMKNAVSKDFILAA